MLFSLFYYCYGLGNRLCVVCVCVDNDVGEEPVRFKSIDLGITTIVIRVDSGENQTGNVANGVKHRQAKSDIFSGDLFGAFHLLPPTLWSG